MNACIDITDKAESRVCSHSVMKTKIIGSLIGIIAGFVLVVAIETTFIETPPILIGKEEVVGFNRADDLILDYRRNLGAYHEFFAIRTVRVTCNGISYSTPDSIHYYQEENPKPARTYYVLQNFRQEEGTKCTMHRTLVWKPSFSLQDKTFSLPMLEFKVVEQQKKAK